MSDGTRAHPDADLLAAFGLGRLDDTASAEVEAHLLACEACRTLVERLPDDTLVSLVRASGPRPEGATASYGAAAAAPAEVPAELAGHSRYRVLGLLGVGGMGAVYKAEHLLMERPVALKVVGKDWTGDSGRVERFRREMKAAAQLAHPNIVTAHDAEQVGDSHLLVMEHVEGTSLARLLAERGPLPVALACDYARQAASGLQHAYERGMVHRDVKPHNLMLTAAGQVKILDFGLARFVRESLPAEAIAATAGSAAPAGLTEAGTVMGTPDYIAPEQARDAHAADIRADIYSLGCTLYALLTGAPPFPDGGPAEKVAAHQEREPRPLTEARPEVPEGLARVVARMMAKDPAARYQTPADVVDALTPYAGRGAPRPRRRWVAAAVVGVALGVAAAVAVLVLGRVFGFLPPFQTGRTELAQEKDGHPAELDSGRPAHPGLGGPSAQGADTRPAVVPGEEVRLFQGHTAGVWSVAFSSDGKRAISGSSDKTIRLWDVATGGELKKLSGHTNRIEAVAISPDDGRIVSGGADGTIRLWDVKTGREIGQLQGHEGVVMSVAFSPDGTQILSGGQDRKMRLWDVATRAVVCGFLPARSWVYRVAFASDGKHVLSACPEDRSVYYFDPDMETEPLVFGSAEPVWSMAISPDGKRILAGHGGEWVKGDWVPGKDNTIKVWDFATNTVLRRLVGHTDGVMSLAFSPDGKRAVSGGADGTVRVWDLDGGKQLHCLRGHTARVMGVAFSPDGHHVLSGGWDNTVRLWEVGPD